MNQVFFWILGATILNGLVAFAGVLTLWMNDKSFKKILFFLVAFSAGTLLGGAFLHLLPESLESMDAMLVSSLIISGFCVFYIVEK